MASVVIFFPVGTRHRSNIHRGLEGTASLRCLPLRLSSRSCESRRDGPSAVHTRTSAPTRRRPFSQTVGRCPVPRPPSLDDKRDRRPRRAHCAFGPIAFGAHRPLSSRVAIFLPEMGACQHASSLFALHVLRPPASLVIPRVHERKPQKAATVTATEDNAQQAASDATQPRFFWLLLTWPTNACQQARSEGHWQQRKKLFATEKKNSQWNNTTSHSFASVCSAEFQSAPTHFPAVSCSKGSLCKTQSMPGVAGSFPFRPEINFVCGRHTEPACWKTPPLPGATFFLCYWDNRGEPPWLHLHVGARVPSAF